MRLRYFAKKAQKLSTLGATVQFLFAAVAVTVPLDPSIVGPDLPPVGRSIFDELVYRPTPSGGRELDLPYPLTKLREKISSLGDRRLGQIDIIVPLGRALQDPVSSVPFDPFSFPTTLLAFGNSANTQSKFDPSLWRSLNPWSAAGLDLRNRVFIGHISSRSMLEVISDNPALGRSEFQLVTGYDGKQAPRVFYAPRAMCIVCHQNQSTVFTPNPWAETDANNEISRLLQFAHPEGSFDGVDLRRGHEASDKAAEAFESSVMASAESNDPSLRLFCPGEGDARALCRRQLILYALIHELELQPDLGKPHPGFPFQEMDIPGFRAVEIAHGEFSDRRPLDALNDPDLSKTIDRIKDRAELADFAQRVIDAPLSESENPRTPRSSLNTPVSSILESALYRQRTRLQQIAFATIGAGSEEQALSTKQFRVVGSFSPAAGIPPKGNVLLSYQIAGSTRDPSQISFDALSGACERVAGVWSSCSFSKPGEAQFNFFFNSPGTDARRLSTLRVLSPNPLTEATRCWIVEQGAKEVRFECYPYDPTEAARKIQARVDLKIPMTSDLLRSQAFSVDRIAAALEGQTLAETRPTGRWPQPSVFGESAAAGELLSRSHDPVVREFVPYCARCHGSEQGMEPHFLLGSRDDLLLQALHANATHMISRLTRKDRPMPPVGSPEDLKLRALPSQRDRLVRILQGFTK